MSNLAIRWDEWSRPKDRRIGDGRFELTAFSGRALRPAVLASVVGIGYYIGASIGFLFTLPGAPQSILWLPNSILLAVLLITPPAHWPRYLLAALPAQMLVAWQEHAPFGTMALLYLTNCGDAALGATLVRVVTRKRWSLNSLQNLAIMFLFGALLAPVIVSFLDAGITVATGWGSSFPLAYFTRLRANALANIIFVPALVGTLGARVAEWRHSSVERHAEAALLLGMLLAVSAFVYSRDNEIGGMALYYLPIPILLWAAVRFGPGTTGWALLIVAAGSCWSAVHGVGAFKTDRPEATIVALQLFLLCVSVPLMCLAMTITERAEAMRELVASRNAVRISTDTVRDLASRLIAAQEQERGRVARELHDGVSQHVAELAITLSTMRRKPAVRAAGLEADFLRLYDETSGLFESVRALSHQLHPSVLRHAGLGPAVEALVSSFGESNGTHVALNAEAVDPLPDAVALCAYRVAQEALHNVSKHAQARHVDVSLLRGGDELLLVVRDDGGGFDPESARRRSHGLGLVSMEERVRGMHGQIAIQSSSGGSSISIRLPVPEWSA